MNKISPNLLTHLFNPNGEAKSELDTDCNGTYNKEEWELALADYEKTYGPLQNDEKQELENYVNIANINMFNHTPVQVGVTHIQTAFPVPLDPSQEISAEKLETYINGINNPLPKPPSKRQSILEKGLGILGKMFLN